MSSRFPFGEVVITPGAQETVHAADIRPALARHASGDWGDVDEHDRQVNEQSLIDGARLFSVYHDRNKTKFWIITEADRSATTILLPDEY